jgi:hypothetical protein
MGRPRKYPTRVVDGVAHWTCSNCGTEKTEFEFPKSNQNSNGLDSWCKTCKAEYHADRYRSKKRWQQMTEEYIGELETRLREHGEDI